MSFESRGPSEFSRLSRPCTSPNVLTEKACEDAAQGLRGLEVICDVADDTLVLLCSLGESKAITLFFDNCLFGCLFSVECVSC